jgi:hypothetical protein
MPERVGQRERDGGRRLCAGEPGDAEQLQHHLHDRARHAVDRVARLRDLERDRFEQLRLDRALD